VRTIAHISDLHFGRHEPAIVECLLASLSENEPDVVALSGDFTQRARESEFAEARRFLDRVGPPKLVVPGNHDVPLYNVFARFLAPFAKYDQYVQPAGYPGGFFCDDEIAVLGLNTARRFTRKNGRISVEQMAQIGRMFRDVPKDRFKAVVTHHPLGMPVGGAAFELAGRSSIALEALAHAGVHLLLSGHHHRALSGHIADIRGAGSVLVVHAGTAISTRLRGGEANSYNLVCVDGQRVSVRVMAWSTGAFSEARCAAYVLQNERWCAV
jgi:3',5'-cyclic AMP phosphodiesterase CpdA